jgi:PIN domain nuclease of toxin-antitoxin system
VKLLLDTHIWLWALMEPDKLGRRVRRALEAGDRELWLSPISTWEAMLLVDRGRLALEVDAAGWFLEAHHRLPTKEAMLTHEIAAETRRIALPHRDPADTFLAATARVLDLKLVTADERLLRGKGFSVLANG